jgi:hypothetical protein
LKTHPLNEIEKIMTTIPPVPSAPGGAEAWMLQEASKPNSLCGCIHRDSIAGIAARMDSEIPNASDEHRTAWVAAFLPEFPMHIDERKRPHLHYMGDPTKLSAVEKLSVANGGVVAEKKPIRPELAGLTAIELLAYANGLAEKPKK